MFSLVLFVVEADPGDGCRHGPRHRAISGSASVAGLCLAAPLLLPGLQLISRSSRSSTGSAFDSQAAIPFGQIGQSLLPGLNGWPVQWSRVYLGIVALILALVGAAFHRRRPGVVALVVVAALAAVATFVPAVISVLNALPGLRAVRFPRSFGFLEFALAVLAAVGLSSLTARPKRRPVILLAGMAFASAGLVSVIIWVASGSGDDLRTDSFIWAIAGAVVGLGSVGLAGWGRGPRPGVVPSGSRALLADVLLPQRVAAGLLVVFETVFLVVMGTSGWPSTSTPFAPTPAVRQLQAAVGSSLVGMGTTEKQCAPSLGIPANANGLYGIREFWVYDPMLPRSYYSAWTTATGQTAGDPDDSSYCPAVTSAAMARRYGVSYVLDRADRRGPRAPPSSGPSAVRTSTGYRWWLTPRSPPNRPAAGSPAMTPRARRLPSTTQIRTSGISASPPPGPGSSASASPRRPGGRHRSTGTRFSSGRTQGSCWRPGCRPDTTW